MGLKINLNPPRWIRKIRVTIKPRDILLAARVATGTATSTEIAAKALELATSSTCPPAGSLLPEREKAGTIMTTGTPSWRKITVTLITIVLTLVQLYLQPNAMTPEHAATTITGLVITGIAGIAFVLMQGKFDLAKLASTPTGASIEQFIESKLADILTPVMEKVQTAGTPQGTVGYVTSTPAPPVTTTVTMTQNPDGSYTLQDGTVLSPK